MTELSATDQALADHYLRDGGLGEGTWIIVAPMTVTEARARLLGPDPRVATEADQDAIEEAEISAYVFHQVGDGVVAWEDTGFADPPKRLLAELSRDGAVSAVMTDNIEAMTRFGYARDGDIVFDASEFVFVDSLEEIPSEVRDLAALAWSDLDGPTVERAEPTRIAAAMCEKVTGIRATGDVEEGAEAYIVPMLWGVLEDEEG